MSEVDASDGDLVHVAATNQTDGATGTVEDLTLRITRLRTPDGELVVIPNSQVVQVTNLSSEWPDRWWTCPCPPRLALVAVLGSVLAGMG